LHDTYTARAGLMVSKTPRITPGVQPSRGGSSTTVVRAPAVPLFRAPAPRRASASSTRAVISRTRPGAIRLMRRFSAASRIACAFSSTIVTVRPPSASGRPNNPLPL